MTVEAQQEQTTLPTGQVEEIKTETTPTETTTDESSTVETPAEETSTEENQETHAKSGFEKRINKLNAKITAKAQEVEYWKQEAMKKQSAPQAAQHVEAPAVQMDKPKLEQYPNLEAYTEALTDYKLNLRDAQMQQRSVQTQQQSAINNYTTKVNEFLKTTPDFHEVLEDVADLPCASEIHQACLDSDMGPQMAYYLAKNSNELERINALPAHRRFIEMGKIEDKLTRDSVKNTPKPTKPAPAPVKPVTGAVSVTDKTVYEMTPQELMAHRNAQDAKRRRR